MQAEKNLRLRLVFANAMMMTQDIDFLLFNIILKTAYRKIFLYAVLLCVVDCMQDFMYNIR